MINKEIRIVPDTNVLISSIFWRGNPYRVMRYGYERRYKLILSLEILDEFIRKMRDKFKAPEEKIKKEVDILS